MRIARFAIALALLLPVASCEGNQATVAEAAGPDESMFHFSPAESLEPLYSENDAVYDPSLEGDWLLDGEEGFALHFESAGNRTYHVSLTDDPTVFEVHLLRLGNHLLLDAVPVQWKGQAADLDLHLNWAQAGVELAPSLTRMEDGIYLETAPVPIENPGVKVRVRIRPAHMFFRLVREENVMRLLPLDGEWLAQGLKNGSLRIDHIMVEDEPVLSAHTADLQRLVVENENDPAAFAGRLSFQKKE